MRCMSTDRAQLAEQYGTDDNLRTRIDTHKHFTVGPDLEPMVDEILRLTGGESLLDVGTGPGDFPARLSRAGHRGRLVGVDASPGMIHKARANCAAVEWLNADAQSLPFPDGSFDVATARHMLYHVPDVPSALREIKRVLTPSGRFLAITNARDYFAEYRQALLDAAETAADASTAGILRSEALSPVSAAFDDVTGLAFVRDAFESVEIRYLQSALHLPAIEPVLRYHDSARTMLGYSEDAWQPARKAFANVLRRRLSNGKWIVSKRIALISATA